MVAASCGQRGRRVERTGRVVIVTLGLSRNRSVGEIKGNQATFDNSQRNNLRSCVWVRWVVFVRMFVLISLGEVRNPLSFVEKERT